VQQQQPAREEQADIKDLSDPSRQATNATSPSHQEKTKARTKENRKL